MEQSPIYHGGGPGKPGFSFGSGGGSSSGQFVTVPFTWADSIFNGVEIPAPAYDLWVAGKHGWYFDQVHRIREVNFLFNEIDTVNATSTCTIALKKIIADGTAVETTIQTTITTFPNTGGAQWNFIGNSVLGLDIQVPAGYQLVAECLGETAVQVDGVSIWVLLEKETA